MNERTALFFGTERLYYYEIFLAYMKEK